MAKKNLEKFKVSPTLQITIQQNEKISFYKRIENKVVDMTSTCFVILIATAALCYGAGAAVGWHIKKSVTPQRKAQRKDKEVKKGSAARRMRR